MKRLRRAVVAFVLGSVALFLTACGGDGPVPKAPKAEVRPTPAGSTPVAKEETPEEFIRRWFRANEEMQNTGDTTEYLALAPRCRYCRKTAQMIEGFYAAGGSVSSEGHQITSVSRYRTTKNRHLVKVRYLPTEYTSERGADARRMKGGNVEYIVTLESVDGAWQVLDMTKFLS